MQLTSLKVLRLNNVGVGSCGGRVVGAALQRAATAGLRLRTFVLGRSRLESAGARSVAHALQTMGSLVELHLPQNGIRRNGIVCLAGALSANRDLEVLNLNDNTAGRSG